MASYNKFVLTDNGNLLLNKVLSNECDLIITKAATGAYRHESTEDLKTLTALGDQKQIFSISSFSRSGDKIFLKFVISNFEPATGTGLDEEYHVREIGLFAEDPDMGEILYAISTAESERGDFLPVYDENSPVTVTINTYIVVGNGGNVRVNILPDAYALAEDLMELKENCPYNGVDPILISGADISHAESGVTAGSYGDTMNQTPAFGGTFKVPSATVDEYGHLTDVAEHTVKIPAETKNTAGSMDTSSKIFLIGATSQATSPQTYSQDTAYVGTDGHVYSNGKQVVNLSDSQALTNKKYNGYTLADACARGVTDTPTSTANKLLTSAGAYANCQPVIKYTDVSWTTTLGPDMTSSSISSSGWTSLTGTGYNKHPFAAQIIHAWPKGTWENAQVTIVNTDLEATYPQVQLRAGTLQQYQIVVRFFYTDNEWNNTTDK